MFQDKDHFQHPYSDRSDAPPGSISRFPGLPPAIELEVDWRVQVWDSGNREHALQLFDNDMAVTEAADGSQWENDVIGAAATITFDVNGFPPFFDITTTATGGQGHQMQQSVGTREMFDFSVGSNARPFELFMAIVFRLVDANNDADTVEQMELFFGLAPIDTTVFTAVDDAIGLYSPDGSGNLNLIVDDDSGALENYSNTVTLANLSTFSSANDNTNAANEWLQAGFYAQVKSQTNNLGLAHGFVNNRDRAVRRALAQPRPPTHRGSLAMVEVPDQALAPTLAFATGESLAKQLQVAKMVVAARYPLGL